MLKKAIALITASVLLLSPMTASAVTWGDIMTGIHTTGSFSGGGTTATKEGDTITVSGGEVEFAVEKTDEYVTTLVDDIRESGSYVFDDVALSSLSGTLPLVALHDGKINITFSNTSDLSGIDSIDVHLSSSDPASSKGSVHIENNTVLDSGNSGLPPLYITLKEGGQASFSMSGSGTLSRPNGEIIRVQMDARNVDFDRIDEFVAQAEESIRNQVDLSSIQDSQLILTPGDAGTYVLRMVDGENNVKRVEGVLDLTATQTAAPEQPTETTAPEQPAETAAPEATPTPAPAQEDNGPSEEQIRHEMEMKRQAEAVGGITGSPYWCSQLFLNYHSRNLWLHNAEGQKVNFREHIRWEGEYPNKLLLLRVHNMESTDGLTMRFDEETLNAFDGSGIVTIVLANTVNGQVEPFMQYNVADLRAAREQYGLTPDELLVVGGVDDEVMKCAIGGEPVPV